VKVAVITPYYRADEDWLEKCHASVMAQTHPCTHILVADGEPQDIVSSFDTQHIVSGTNHGDYGDTPRAMGSVSAAGQGFDAIAWLDADNWYEPSHIEALLEIHRKHGAEVCTSARMLYALDESPLGLCPDVDGKKFVDTNCFLLTRGAFHMISIWSRIEHPLHAIGDTVFWDAVQRSGLGHRHNSAATLAYRTSFRYHYRLFGKKAPRGAREIPDIAEAKKYWRAQKAAREEASGSP